MGTYRLFAGDSVNNAEDFWLIETHRFLGSIQEVLEHARALANSFESNLLFTESEHQDMRDRFDDAIHQMHVVEMKFEDKILKD